MSDQQYNDEIDLGVVFQKVKEGILSLLLLIFKGVRFLIRKIWIILIVVAIGAVIGYFLQKDAWVEKEAGLVVQVNFEGVDYVYSRIELLNAKIRSNDSIFLKRIGFKTDDFQVNSIEISPLVDIVNLIENTSVDSRSLEAFFNEIKNEDEDLLSSKLFYNEYKKHEIVVLASGDVPSDLIQTLLDHLNANEHFTEIKDQTMNDLTLRLAENKKIIAQIDTIIRLTNSRIREGIPASRILVETDDGGNTNELLQTKRELMRENEYLEKNLIEFEHTVVAVNDGYFTEVKTSIFNSLIFLIPFLLLSLLTIVFIISKGYKKLSDLEANRNNV